MNKKTMSVLLALLVVGMVASGVSAFGRFGTQAKTALENGDYTAFIDAVDKELTEERFEHMVARHQSRQAAHEAIENNDYEAFLEATAGKSRFGEITQERFAEIVERHQAKEAVRDALESSDYDAWVDAVSNLPKKSAMLDTISEDNFPTLVAMHQAKMDGDYETAKTLADELGLERFGKHRRGFR